MPKWSSPLNHLAYANDNIIFSSDKKLSLHMLMNMLVEYEKQSSQKINKAKSFFYVSHKIDDTISQQIKVITSFNKGRFSFTYLGCPIGHARKRKSHFSYLISKIKTISPPKCIIHDLDKLFARYFWGDNEGCRHKHWISWTKMSFPKEEGSLGFRSLLDVSKALFAML
ncbi:hypothetical protein H5410_014428 [Solanum commersonii]|uniref:Reverse transcriptase domain-containing protein n=1 Tax=Solanum commersonii TaxID=4109 RepID=A0A9J5ZRD4_SOLCO|nr:hypothetical protein H5410_014428 [Solanum commersonii]